MEAAFGFKKPSVIWDDNDKLVHAEMKFGAAEIVVNGEWTDFVACPNAIGGKNTQLIYIQLESGIDAHCEHARHQCAEIFEEPADQFYGDHTYRARDIGGHIWTFSQVVKAVSKSDAERQSGMRIEGWW